ncbi:hypothetical protein EDB84DRAFT_172907 [Lactarius hengduanensis]|nr:hypothetical protein EDB84DRAFT_172907 [Lactarius hengduanensis]
MPTFCALDNSQSTLNFPRPFVHSPRLAQGLCKLDMGNNADIRINSTVQNITKTSANFQITPWADTTLYSAAVDVIALAPGDLDFLTGEHMRNLFNNPNDPASVRIEFERPFITPPKVVVFFNCINLGRNRNWRVKTTATGIDVKGFTLNIETWSDTILYAARVCWIAYPEDHEHIFSGSVNTMDVRPWNQPQPKQSSKIGFGGVEFWKTPSVFIALNEIDIDYKANLRVNAYVDSVSTTGLVWHIESWADTTLYSAGATIIAFN